VKRKKDLCKQKRPTSHFFLLGEYDKTLEENAKDRKMFQDLLKNLNGLMKDENESTRTIEKNIDSGVVDINKKIDQKYNQVAQ
jgi:hypothetical protein